MDKESYVQQSVQRNYSFSPKLQTLKFGNGYEISSHALQWMYVFILVVI